MVDLLSRFNLEERIISENYEGLGTILEKEIDAKVIDMYIKSTTESGIRYLKDYILD